MVNDDDVVVSEGEKKDFILVPAATYQAVAYDFWDIGFQKSSYKGNPLVQPKIVIAWEVNEIIPNGEYAGKRFTVSKRYTKSLGEKAHLRKDLVSWRGKPFTPEELKGFSLKSIIGANCMLTVIHNTVENRTYANVNAVTGLLKGLPKLAPENGRSLPEWIKKLREKAITNVKQDEHGNMHDASEPEAEDESEIPF